MKICGIKLKGLVQVHRFNGSFQAELVRKLKNLFDSAADFVFYKKFNRNFEFFFVHRKLKIKYKKR